MADLMEAITSLAKRRGIVFQSSEIYGGLRSCWDYGPLGVELKKNVKAAWWRAMVQLRDDIVGLDSSILMSPKVWETSGHVQGFTDPLVECADCHRRFRADHVTTKECPECGGRLSEPRRFNLMFKTHMGPVEDESHVVYLRPETAQGIFVDFVTVQQASRKKIPFGIAQQGKSFRNEITPGNFIFRTREFEQMEMEFFVEPGTDAEWLQHWLEERYSWYTALGIRDEKLRTRKHGTDELAHYAKETHDIEYEFPFGWSELEGVANRTDFDLRAHAEATGEDLTYFDQENGNRYAPFVIEPAAGADRATLAFLVDAYREEEAPNAKGEMEKRTVLKFHKDIAPIKVAVLPLSRKDTLMPEARRVFDILKHDWMCDFDDAGSIGRRYRRQDEAGTPYCVTVDFDSLEDRQVTVRDRDSMSQDRIAIDALPAYLKERL
jgi:glycyl-tRNA synthetase